MTQMRNLNTFPRKLLAVLAVLAVLALLACTFTQAAAPPEYQAAELMLIGFPGMEPGAFVRYWVGKRGVSGVVLWKGNIRSVEAGRALNLKLLSISHHRPLLILLDHEGGRVNRMRELMPPPPSAEQLTEMAPAEASRSVHALSKQLRNLGAQINLAPVVDLREKVSDAYLGSRTFSSDPDRVSKMAKIWIESARNESVVSAVKHFPGYWGVAQDTHYGPAWSTMDLATWRNLMQPVFESVISAGARIVLTSHARYPKLAAELGADPVEAQRPATISRWILTSLLRERLGFRGAIISDDIRMPGVTSDRRIGDAAVEAVKAGVDMVIVGYNPNKKGEVREVHAALTKAIRVGEISAARMAEAKERIQALRAEILQTPAFFPEFKWWVGTESNRRHMPFQGIALPTELPTPREP
jgi:beta-N-acetylhexosaminidase